jgi:DNA-binding NarL/FixJ family response regulator
LEVAVKEVCEGRSYRSPSLLFGNNQEIVAPSRGLTDTEWAAYQLLRSGLKQRAAAKALGLTVKCLEYHLRKLRTVLGLPPERRIDWRTIQVSRRYPHQE